MSSPPGRRAAPQPEQPEGGSTRPARAAGGRRASEPTTGTIPVIDAPLLGDEPRSGRRIRAAAPVSTAGDTDDRRVVRSFDHTGEIPAVQFTLPPPDPARLAPATGAVALPEHEGHGAEAPLFRDAPRQQDAVPVAGAVPENTVDLPPVWRPSTPPVPRGPVVPDAVELIAAVEAARPTEKSHRADSAGSKSSWGRRVEARAARKAAAAEPLDALAEAAAANAAPTGPDEAAGSHTSRSHHDSRRSSTSDSRGGSRADRTPRRAETESPGLVSGSTSSSPGARKRLTIWSGVLAVGVVLLALAALHVGPGWFDGVGAVAVLTTYCWVLAGRTGGRQVVFSAVGGCIGATALLVDSPVLRSGAAMMTCVVSAVLAVCLTVPARNFLTAVREVVIATAVASIGAFAVIGFEPVASTSRFEILALCLGMAVMVALVWRFAAGLHGLGTRGLVIVVIGTVLLTASQLYTELLRAYGDSGMAQPTGGLSSWLRETFGASPRTTMVFLGVPALVWGVHMRARRRQGWWVCTFGAAATLPVAQRLVNLETSYVEAGLQTFYSVLLGCLIGWVLIRLDLRMTGTRGARARADEEGGALRPEPPRFSSL